MTDNDTVFIIRRIVIVVIDDWLFIDIGQYLLVLLQYCYSIVVISYQCVCVFDIHLVHFYLLCIILLLSI